MGGALDSDYRIDVSEVNRNLDLAVQAAADLSVEAYVGLPSYLKALIDKAAAGGDTTARELIAHDYDPESVTRRTAFEQAMKELGWTNGGNLRIENDVYRGQRAQEADRFVERGVFLVRSSVEDAGEPATAPKPKRTRS